MVGPIRLDGSLLRALRQAHEAELEAICGSVSRSGGRLEGVTGEISDRVDRSVAQVAAWAQAELERQAPGRRRAAARIALVALGSYGRRELCPRSDVDLLFLLPSGRAAADPDGRAYVDAVLYGLWDLGFEVGHAVRTEAECLRLAGEDHSALSALFDTRLIETGAEDATVRAEAVAALDAAVTGLLRPGRRADAFIEAKRAESAVRRARFGTTVFLLEPNVKESEGGLRELHVARWVARARFGVEALPVLVDRGVLSAQEAATVGKAYAFLLLVRVELHRLARRRQDVLGFHYQELVAARLGYVGAEERDHDKKTHGVERFMRAYYFHARNLRHLAALLLERARPVAALAATSTVGGFLLRNEALAVPDAQTFAADRGALLRIFRIAQQEALPIDSYTKNLISESRGLIDRQARRSPALVQELLLLLEDPKADGAIMEALHDLGLLRRLIPEFGRVTARWQHSQYHVYTVDAHSIFVVRCLKALKNGAFSSEEPLLTKLVADLPRLRVLYLAGLLHDIGKGWPRGDHSKRGARVAETVGRRFEAAGLPSWTAADTADLVWLVEEHLTLSDCSQRRDLNDPHLIEQISKNAGTVERLTMLYVLTFADMKSTSPKVWNTWKGALLQELYQRTLAVLQEGGDQEGALHLEARRQQAEAELAVVAAERGTPVPAALRRTFVDAVPPRYLVSVPPRQMVRHLQMWQGLRAEAPLAFHVRHLLRDDVSRLTVAGLDRPGLLAILAGVLAAHRLQILSAEIYSVRLPFGAPTPLGALDVLYVKDEEGHAAADEARWRRVEADLEGVLRGSRSVEDLVAPRSQGLASRPRPAVKTELLLSNRDSKTETVIDVFCQDRIGVLYTIARALTGAGLSISLAKISTQGDRVADGFYVTDATTGEKIEGALRLESIRTAVLGAIDGGR